NRSPSSGTASVLTFTTRSRPALEAATRTSSGATIRHGLHHGAQKSTTTGWVASPTSASKATASGTSTGSATAADSPLHDPQRASRTVKPTRLRCRHDGHVMMRPRLSTVSMLPLPGDPDDQGRQRLAVLLRRGHLFDHRSGTGPETIAEIGGIDQR